MRRFKIILGYIFALNRINVNTVAHDGDGIGLVQNLRKVMGDEDDGVAALTDPVHVFVQLFTSFLGKCGGCLIDDNDLRIKVGCLYDLDELPVLKVILINDICCLDALKAIFFKSSVAFLFMALVFLIPICTN